LLTHGLGDTLRVSLTADPVKEIEAARYILKSLGLIEMPELISCPTCGRTEIDIISLANAVEKRLKTVTKNIYRGRHGLCGQWSRRGGACRFRYCRRQTSGDFVRQRKKD